MPNPLVLMETSSGSILLELYEKEAPITVKNFLRYVQEGFYNNTIFHRVIKDFMVQGGGLTPKREEKKVYDPIQNEANNGKKNLRGTVAMARTEAIHSAQAQFFINVVDNDFLDYVDNTSYGYCVFGSVIDGMDSVDAIQKVPTIVEKNYEAIPKELILITEVIIFE
ncbi:MAG: peptidylprolyl isomerase [Desulfovibrionaceae bacterium]